MSCVISLQIKMTAVSDIKNLPGYHSLAWFAAKERTAFEWHVKCDFLWYCLYTP